MCTTEFTISNIPVVWSIQLLFIDWDWFKRYSLEFKFNVIDGLTLSIEWKGVLGENEYLEFVGSSILGANAIVAWLADA